MFEKSLLGKHISQRFNEELENIRNRVLTMGGLVEELVGAAIKALVSHAEPPVEAVKAEDRKVNLLEVFIDEEVAQIVARRQPTASDLRLVLGVSRTIVDLERIGDEAKKIVKLAAKLSHEDRSGRGLVEIENLGEHVRDMVRNALDAFARLDAKAAFAVAQEDDKVDREHEAILRQNMTFMLEDPRNIGRCVQLMWAARALERIGDHARNIGEHVIFMVVGKDVRHLSLDEVQAYVEEAE